MQFLVDAQLPPALARWISAQGYSAYHVADIGMASARDPEIWDRAYGDGAIIINKDEYFAMLRTIYPDGPTHQRKALVFGQQKINLHSAGRPIAPHAASPTPGSTTRR